MKIAIAGVIGKWSTERLAECLRERGVETTLFQVWDCLLDLDGGTVRYQGEPLEGFDGVVVKKMGELTHENFTYRLGVLRQLERNGARVFSPPDQIAVVADRLEVTRIPAGSDTPPCLKLSHKKFETVERTEWEYLRFSLPITCLPAFIE